MDWFFSFLAGTAAGILSGFGVGGGTLLLIYLTAAANLPQQLAQGINLLYFLPAAATALPSHLKNGYIERSALLPAISSGLLCAGAAAWLATSLNTELLHRCFGGFLICVGISELRKR